MRQTDPFRSRVRTDHFPRGYWRQQDPADPPRHSASTRNVARQSVRHPALNSPGRPLKGQVSWVDLFRDDLAMLGRFLLFGIGPGVDLVELHVIAWLEQK